ncbi:uncharacterized protein [Coffea arabica]|uniref:Uncharacterized protein n=1 Tax=Coffea arabica TaxID=13443 RepID=A0ABM4UYB4_COFAR
MGKLCSKGFDKGTSHRKAPPPVGCPLRCTLDELYTGVENRIKFPGGRMKLLPAPGVILEDRKVPRDVIVDVIEEPHAEFHRQGNDLWAIRKIPLMEYVTNEALVSEIIKVGRYTIEKNKYNLERKK